MPLMLELMKGSSISKIFKFWICFPKISWVNLHPRSPHYHNLIFLHYGPIDSLVIYLESWDWGIIYPHFISYGIFSTVWSQLSFSSWNTFTSLYYSRTLSADPILKSWRIVKSYGDCASRRIIFTMISTLVLVSPLSFIVFTFLQITWAGALIKFLGVCPPYKSFSLGKLVHR